MRVVDGRFITDRGLLRSTNEDAGGVFYNAKGQLLAIVADGMGGHQAGEVASELAVLFLKNAWENIEQINTPIEAENWLKSTVKEANKHIYDHAIERDELEGMGTTVVISICTVDFITIAHIGDSRCYLLNETSLEQLTEDHSLVNELIRTGQITETDAAHHPRKNVLLRAVGTEESVDVDIETIGWGERDRLLLCSDGLTNKLTDKELEHYLRTMDNLEDISKELVHLANERGGEDNISLALIENNLVEDAGELSC